jgi:LacI family transcriptional regulator
MSEIGRAVTPGRRTTIKDVARAVGVDQSLVSRVVNGDPKASASPATRKKILDAVEQLGYRANVVARGLRMARTWTIGFVVPDFENPLYNTIVKGVESEAAGLGYGTVLGAHPEGAGDDTFARLLQQGRVDGLLAASGNLRDSFMREVSTSGLGPVVLVNRRVRGVKASVVVDDEAGARVAVRYLRELGHETVAGLFGPGFTDTARRRRQGFEAACADAGVKGIVNEMPAWDTAAGFAATGQVLADRPDVTALFASTFLMGMGALSAARELKVAVPSALSIISLHDSRFADYLAPPLTTVAMPTEEMGREAARLLVSMVNGQPGRHIVAAGEPSLVLRKSTGPRSARRAQANSKRSIG